MDLSFWEKAKRYRRIATLISEEEPTGSTQPIAQPDEIRGDAAESDNRPSALPAVQRIG